MVIMLAKRGLTSCRISSMRRNRDFSGNDPVDVSSKLSCCSVELEVIKSAASSFSGRLRRSSAQAGDDSNFLKSWISSHSVRLLNS